MNSIVGRFARLLSVSATASALSIAATQSSAEELAMSVWLPPAHPIVSDLIKPWAEEVGQVTEGRVTVRMLARPLGPPPAHFDLAVDGIADITVGLHSFTTDNRFLRSRIGQFSFLGESAETLSEAYWNVYTQELDAAKEHEGTKLLSLWVHGPGLFHNNQREIATPEDFAGLKIRTPGGYIAELVSELGATTQFMGPGQVFEKLSTGVIDGVTFPSEGVRGFNLSDHLTHTMRIPGGIYNTSWFFVMNEDKWNDISDADKAAIEAISGGTLAAKAGIVWDNSDKRGWDTINGSDMQVYDASPAVVARIQEIAGAKEAEWSAAVADQGLDGTAALASIRAQAAE